MSDKFQGKYRISSTRLQNWDYGWNAILFVTICTANRECYFGNIVNGEMILSEIGKLANKYWLEIPEHFSFVILDEYVIMPNHVHGIIAINKPNNGRNNVAVCIDGYDDKRDCRDAINRVSTETNSETETDPLKTGGFAGNKNPMLNNNLSRILRWFKGRVAFESRKIYPVFAWQPRFHDHIIRNDQSFQKISEYINNNPSNWKDGNFHENKQ